MLCGRAAGGDAVEGADVLRAEAIRRGAKVFGELGGVAQIAIDRVG
jgi:hypothetical protein